MIKENGKWHARKDEWRPEDNGHWSVENGDWSTKNGKQKMKGRDGLWRIDDRRWRQSIGSEVRMQRTMRNKNGVQRTECGESRREHREQSA